MEILEHKLVANSGCSSASLAPTFCVYNAKSLQPDSVSTSFWPTCPSTTEGHSAKLFAQTRPATVQWSRERWSGLMGFLSGYPKQWKLFWRAECLSDQWSDIPPACWTERLFLKALGESFLWLCTQECWWCDWWGKGEGWDLFFPAMTALLLYSLSFLGPKYHNLMWERLRGTSRSWCRCSWCDLDREDRSAPLWMFHSCVPESFLPAAWSRGSLAGALLAIGLQEGADGVKNRLTALRFPGLGSLRMVQNHCQTGRGSHVRGLLHLLLCPWRFCWWRCAGSVWEKCHVCRAEFTDWVEKG